MSLLISRVVYPPKFIWDEISSRYMTDVEGTVEINDCTTLNLPLETWVWTQQDIQYYEGSYRFQDADSLLLKQLAGPPVVIKYPRPDLYRYVNS